MSLIHWWPLNGDLKDYGINNANLTNNGATVNNSGKIGSCYTLDGTDDYFQGPSFTVPSSGCFSITGWYYHNSNNVWSRLFEFTNQNVNGITTAKTVTGLACGSNGATLTSFNGKNATGTTNKTWITLTTGTWYHWAMIFNGATSYLYINGVLQGSATYTSYANDTFTYTFFGKSSWTADKYLNGKLNDLRIYDHALSAKEVKEISKGLVLHYDFNDPYVEGTTNRVNVSSPFSTCYNGSTGQYGWGSNTDMYKEYGTFQGKLCTKVRMGTAGLTAWPFPFFDNVNPYSISSNTYNTLSFDYYTTHITSLLPYSYRDGIQINSYLNGVSMNGATITGIPLNQWCHITIVFKRTNDSYVGDGVGYVRIGTGAHTSTTTDYWLFANIQSEYKDHETPYVNGTRSAGTVFDCSGYGYDGALIGDCQVVSNSNYGNYSLLNNSTNIGTNTSVGAAYIKGDLKTSFSPSVLTICFWAKVIRYDYQNSGILSLSINSDSPTDYNYNGVHQYDSVFRFNGSSNTGYISASSLIDVNNWHHYALVYNGSVLSSYRDGVSITDASYSLGNIQEFRYIYLGLNVAGGAWRQSRENWSDFKIYSTALSASDILAEYQRKAAIDKSGILFTGEFEEGNSTNINITKTAMVKCNNIVEGSSNVKFIGGYTQLEYIDQVNPIAQGTSQHNRCVIDNVQYNYIEARLNVNGSGSSGGIMLAGKDGTWWRSWQGNGSSSVVMNPSSLSQNTWYDVKYTCNSVFTGLWTSGWSDATNYWTPQNLKINYIRTYNNSILTGYFIPVKRNKDNVLGLYDLINKKFYTNAGTGTFTAGPEIGKINAIYAKEIKEI